MVSLRDRDFVDVMSELSYWQERFNRGSMIGSSFRDDCAPVIKLACDIYLRDPHGTHNTWTEDLYMHLPTPASTHSAGITTLIAKLCWTRLNGAPSSTSYSSMSLQ